ncbi:MAG: Wzz/FepE/Etk N-terminal domain-containing protein [Nitrolancea sp.]
MEVLIHYGNIIRRWWWVILISAVLGGVGAYILSSRMTPTYRTSSIVMIDQVEDPTAPGYQDVLASQHLVDTYAERMTSQAVLQATAAELGIGQAQLAQSVRTDPILNTSLVRVTVTDSDPARAVEIANRLPAIFIAHDQSVQQAQFTDISSRLTDQLNSIAGDIKNAQAQINEAQKSTGPDAQATLERLNSDLTSYRSSYANLLEKYGELRIADAQNAGSVVIDQQASLPHSPISPNVTRNTVLGGLAGLVLALSAAIILNYFDDRVRNSIDLDFALRGGDHSGEFSLPRPYADQGNMVVVGNNGSTGAASFRLLQRLLHGARDHLSGARVVMVAPPRDGTSAAYVTGGLAEATARSGYSVIVIDADLRNPGLHRYFGTSNSRGLATVTNGSAPLTRESITDVLIPIGSNLKILPAGEDGARIAINLDRVRALLGHLRKIADVVVVQTAGILDHVDSSVLASSADGVILVVGTGKSRRGEVAEAYQQLSQMDARLLGTVLTRLGASPTGKSAVPSTIEAEQEPGKVART